MLLGSPEKVLLGVMVDARQVGAAEQRGVCVQRLQDLSMPVLRAVITLLRRFAGGQGAMLGDPGKATPERFEGERRLAAFRTDRVEAPEAAFWRRHAGRRYPELLGEGRSQGRQVRGQCQQPLKVVAMLGPRLSVATQFLIAPPHWWGKGQKNPFRETGKE